jgi:sulfatase modifying factor 1
MKASYYKTLLLVLMCLCLFGCSKPEAPALVKEPTEPVLTAAPVEGESFSIPDINLDMLWCKPGTFMMGSPEDRRSIDETQHEVTLTKGFYLGKYEVTQAQWEKVMGKNPSLFEGATLPVEEVDWKDAMEFCKKLTQMEKEAGRLPEGWTYTLPTEAQWEYACRAGTTTVYFFGDEITPKQANYGGNVDKTTPVDTYPANAWGFHDMHGNVWEWCLDWWGDYPSGSASDPVGPSASFISLRVIRGGSWNLDGRNMRSANRTFVLAGLPERPLGFRLSLQTETEKADAPPAVVEAPEVVVASSKLKWRDGLRYFEGKPFTGVAVYGKYKNGQKKFKRTFKDGKGHGLRTAWYETGQKHWESTYKDGNLVTATAWKPNGEKCPDTNIVDGNGIVCSYHKNGQKNKERTYKDGKEISTKEWDEDGNLIE